MSWLLAENVTETARISGKIIDGHTKHAQSKPGTSGRTLEIVLELIPVSRFAPPACSYSPRLLRQRTPVHREGLFNNLNGIPYDARPPRPVQAPGQPHHPAFQRPPTYNPPLAIFETATTFQPLPEVDVSKAVAAPRTTKPRPRKPPKAHSNLFMPKDMIVPAAPMSAPLAGPSTQLSPEEAESPRLKYWAAGCCGCGRTESVSWRIRRKRTRPLSSPAGAQDANIAEAQWKAPTENVAKLCQGASAFPTHRRPGLHAPQNAQVYCRAKGR